MEDALIKQLLEAGVHFGHQTKRWDPRMKSFIFGQRSGVYIIDLQQTAELLKQTCKFFSDLVASGGKILFVGTKKQAREVINSEAVRCEMFYVNQRWLGGTLTNFETIRKSVKTLEETEKVIEQAQKGDKNISLTKKELVVLGKKAAKLKKDLEGVRLMKELPQAIFVVDPKREQIAVKDAKKLGIPVAALIDTNCNPRGINYPIPGNDDALRSIRLITSLITEAIIKGRKKYTKAKAAKKEKEEAEAKASVESKESEVDELAEGVEDGIKEAAEPHRRKKPQGTDKQEE